jgi:hypothetical protein
MKKSSILAEKCQKISANELVKEARKELLEEFLKNRLEIEGWPVKWKTSRTGFGGKRFWLECPVCKQRAGVLYRQPQGEIVACRKCLGLDYKSHRFCGMVEKSPLEKKAGD